MWYSPFWVTNLVGVAITYRVERTGGDAIGNWQRLEPHESAPVRISEMSMLDMDQFALSRLVLVVLVDLPGSNQLVRSDTALYVPLHRVRKYEYQVQIGSTQEQPSFTEDIEPENNNNTPSRVHIVCDVRAQYGSKAVIVQSPVILENHTDMDIEVGLDIPPVASHPTRSRHLGPNSTRPRPLVPLATLPPHSERAPLPLSRVSTAKIRLRPVYHVNTKVPGPESVQIPPLDMPVVSSSDSSQSIVGVVPADVPEQEHDWSINVIDFWAMEAGSDTIVRCGPDYACRVYIHRKTPNIVVKICPVVEFYNYLPCPLFYNVIPSRPPKPILTPAQIEENKNVIQRHRGRTMYEGVIEPEAVKSMTNMFMESHFTLAISIPSQEEGGPERVAWSKPIGFAKGSDKDLYVFKVKPYPSRKESLRINARLKNYKGTLRLEFFNQVWVTNQTGIPLYLFKSQANSMFTKPNPTFLRSSDANAVSFATCPPTMLSFPQLDPARNKVGIAVSSTQRISQPSEYFSLSAIGYRGVAVINQSAPENNLRESNRSYQVGVSVELASNKRTKLVKLSPRYVLVNDGTKAMTVGQPGTNHVTRVGAGERVPLLYWVQAPNCPQILKLNMDADDTTSESWSASFDIKTVGELTLKMERPITIQGYSSLNYIRVHKVLIESTIYVVFSPSAKAPYYIDNQTDMTLNINQAGLDRMERVPPKCMIPFAWDQPLQPHKLEVSVEGAPKFRANYRLDKLKVYPTRKVEQGELVTDLAASIVPEEASRILRLSSSTRQPPHAPTEEIVNQQFRINLRSVGISVISEINHVPHEILYASMDDIYANMSNSDLFQKLEVKLGKLQVDNQLATVKNYKHPVLLSSANQDPEQPFFHLSFVNSNTVPNKNTTHVHYLSALLQELDVKLEERLIYRLMEFSNILGLSDKRDHPTLDPETRSLHDEKQFQSTSVHLDVEALRKQSDNRMYLELLVLNPLKVNLTFNVSHIGMGKNTKETPLLELARNLGFTLVSFENAPIRLNALTLRHAFGAMTDIQQPLQKHYMQQGIREAYKVIGSFDILGNPIHLVRDLGTGFKDFFVEPSRGITHGTDDFKTGLAKGTTSLMKHTIYAISNTTTSLTETTARGFAALSMDKDYLAERDRILRERPSHLGQGVVQGAKGLKAGVKHGVSGVVMLPYKGAKEEGAIGLAKGIPKGIAGVILKPTAGAADLFALSSQSVRNMADPAPKLERKRTPRHFPCDGALSEYNPEKAYGGYLMQALFKHDTPPTSASSKPAKNEIDVLIPSSSSSSTTKTVTMTSSPLHAIEESYVFHIIWKNSTTLLFTNRRLACFADPKAIRKRWDVLLASMLL